MKVGYSGSAWMAVIMCCQWVAAGCTVSMAYGAKQATPHLSAQARDEARVASAQLMDGRKRGRPSELPLVARGGSENGRERQWKALRSSYAEHARRSGFAEAQGLPPAPTTPEEARAILKEAAQRGVRTLLFVRLDGAIVFGMKAPAVRAFDASVAPLAMIGLAPGLLPFVIFYSLRVNTEYVAVQVRGFLVDTRTERVLATFIEHGVVDDSQVAGWDYNPLKELPPVVFKTIDKLFARAADRVRFQQGTPRATTLDGAAKNLEILFEPSRTVSPPATPAPVAADKSSRSTS